MTIQLIRFNNGDHIFYAPYVQPAKGMVEQSGKIGDLVDFIIPDEAQLLVDEHGIEGLFVDGRPVGIFTDVISGKVYLINHDTQIPMDKAQPDPKRLQILSFPDKDYYVKSKKV